MNSLFFWLFYFYRSCSTKYIKNIRSARPNNHVSAGIRLLIKERINKTRITINTIYNTPSISLLALLLAAILDFTNCFTNFTF